MDELGHGNVISPCFRVRTTEDVDVVLFPSLHWSGDGMLWTGRFHIRGYI